MITYAFDLYPRANPVSGARTLRFSKLQEAEYRGEANGTGSGRLVIRGNETDADSIDPAGMQYVRVVRINDAVVDGATLSGFSEKVVGGFFLENGDYEALTERSTKKLEFGGAGALSYLGRAIAAETNYLGAEGPFDGLWHWYFSPAGAILNRMVNEALDVDRPQSPIAGVTMTFFEDLDSDGNAWPGYGTTWLFTAQIGENLLSITRRLMEAGVYVYMDPDTFELSAWMANTHGRDRTGLAWGTNVIRFQAPTDGTIATGNIKSDAKRGIGALIKRSDLLVGSAEGYEWVNDPAADLVWEGSYPVDDPAGTSLSQIGAAQLQARTDAGDTVRLRMFIGTTPASGSYLPFETAGILLDDTATLHTGTGQWDWDESAQKVAAISLKLRPAGDWDAWVDLGSAYSSIAERAFSVQPVGAHTHPPNPRLCDRHVNWVLGLTDASLKASDTEPTFNKSKAVDGDDATRWTPPDGQGPTAEHWWAADLGLSRTAVTFRYYLSPTHLADLASAGSIYGTDDSAAYGTWLTDGGGILTADPVANGWTLVGGWTGLVSGDTGLRDFAAAATYRYWLVRATAGGSGSSNEFDITEFELWSNPLAGSASTAARCDHGHTASEIDYNNTASGLAATDVQAATDEIVDRIEAIELPGQYVLTTDGGKEVVNEVAAAGATETLDLAAGNWHDVTLSADCTITLAGATNGTGCSMLLLLRQDGTGGWEATWPGTVTWPDGVAPVLASEPDAVNIITLVTDDGGASWFGAMVGASGSSATHWEPVIYDNAGTPEIVYFQDAAGVWDIVMHEVAN